jgi:hypothetical protein
MEPENKEKMRVFPDNEVGKLWKQALYLVNDDPAVKREYNLALKMLDGALVKQYAENQSKVNSTIVDLLTDIAKTHHKRCAYRKAWDVYVYAIKAQAEIKASDPKTVDLFIGFGDVAANCKRFPESLKFLNNAKLIQKCINRDPEDPMQKKIDDKIESLIPEVYRVKPQPDKEKVNQQE